MADRLLEVADIAVAAINTDWTPTAPDEVVREYGTEQTLETIDGRKVYVFALGDREVERLDRATVIREYDLSIVIVEKYTPNGELPTKDWMDERLLFCRETVYDVLNVDRVTEYLGTPATLYTATISRDIAYDFDAWRDHSCFWCEINVQLREKVTG